MNNRHFLSSHGFWLSDEGHVLANFNLMGASGWAFCGTYATTSNVHHPMSDEAPAPCSLCVEKVAAVIPPRMRR